MRQTLHITESDYRAIAEAMSGCEEGRHEVDVRIAHDVEAVICFDVSATYREEIGGSYEGYDFERYYVEDSRSYDVVDCSVYNLEGEPVLSDIDARELESYL